MTEKWWVETDDNELQFGYKVTNELFQGKSDFQEVRIVETKAYGKMLIIDNFVMLTESDEFVYHENIAHIPVLNHANPKRVLVIGGGDGGTVTELVKHPGIEEIILCEIDGMVVESCKQFFPEVAKGLNDPRVTVKIGDGIEFIQSLSNEMDIILIDSTDPIGPGEGLFTRSFYKDVAKALKSDGIMAAQTESPWAKASMLKKIFNNIAPNFNETSPYIAPIPTYPRGLWSWTMASKGPRAEFSESRFAEIASELKFLTASAIKNAFDIPPFYKAKLVSRPRSFCIG